MKEYEKYLEQFVCERLSNSDINKTIINDFVNEKNTSIVNTLKMEGWNMDTSNETAFYLVKTKANIPCMFFSIKTGNLFLPLDDKYFKIENLIQNLKKLDDKQLNELTDKMKENEEVKEAFRTFVEKMKKPYKKNLMLGLSFDKQYEGDRPIFRVEKAFSGIELVHFCKNENIPEKIKKEWENIFPYNSMGSIFFWKFVATTILEIRKIVGCRFLYLFAADPTYDSENKLVNYYKSLKFNVLDNIGAVKPYYDFKCIFMSQEINDLEVNSKNFFKNLNLNKEIFL